MAGSKEYFIPPVQPIASAPNSFPGGAPQPKQPGQPPQPGQPGQHDEGQEEKVIEGLMVLVGGICEAMISKGLLTEEDIHNAIASLQQGGSGAPPPNPNGPEKDKTSGGSPGFPGGADTDKGMGSEHGKSKGE